MFFFMAAVSAGGGVAYSNCARTFKLRCKLTARRWTPARVLDLDQLGRVPEAGGRPHHVVGLRKDHLNWRSLPVLSNEVAALESVQHGLSPRCGAKRLVCEITHRTI